MSELESVSFIIALASAGLGAVSGVGHLVARKRSRDRSSGAPARTAVRLTIAAALSGLVFLTLSIVARAVATGHGPFSSMYEFSLAFAWGIVAASLFFWWRYRVYAVSSAGLVAATILLVFAYTLPSRPAPLVPALQQSVLLSSHVAAAAIAYGAFAIGFGATLLYLVQVRYRLSWLPSPGTLDTISYRTAVIGFPCMTLVIVLGAVWANIAWGRYWGWDPKETASLVTWLLFAGYLHARVLRGWRGAKAATLYLIGFLAVLFTFFGNYFLGGLHSYQ